MTLVAAAFESSTAGGWTWLVAAAGVVAGAAVGVLASRMTRLEWDQFEERDETRIDVVGFVVLLAYVAFTIFRSRIVDVPGPAGAARRVDLVCRGCRPPDEGPGRGCAR